MLGCTLPNLANICQRISTGANFYPYTENEKICFQKFEKLWLEDRQYT